MVSAFASPSLLPVLKQGWPSASPRRRRTTVCVVKKMLVVDLQELLRPSASDPACIKDFADRMEVERSTGNGSTYVLFSSVSGYDASMASIRDAGLVEPDALATLNGSELYQRQYRTPDPFWSKTVRQAWTPKPVSWVAQHFFSDEVEEVYEGEEFEVRIKCRDGVRVADVVEGVSKKLSEMGISARVMVGEDARWVIVVPSAGSASEVIAFCQMMLKVEEDATFVFGGDDLISKCVGGKGNRGVVGAKSEHRWEAFGERVYVSKEVGGKALLDGLVYYAVF